MSLKPRTKSKQKVNQKLQHGESFSARTETQKDYIRAIVENDVVYCTGPAGTGKAQPIDSIIYTPSGPKYLFELKIGDLVLTPNGDYAQISNIFPQGEKEVYNIHFSDGTHTECCEEHLWNVESPSNFSGIKTLSLKEIVDYGIYTNSGKRKLRIPITKPVCFNNKEEFLIPPYMMGLLLGDGSFRGKVCLTSSDKEIVDYLTNNIDSKYMLRRDKISYVIKSIEKTQTNIYHQEIKRLGLWNTLSNTKFIPDEYKYISEQSRLELLNGLLDTDGYISKDSYIDYTTTSEQLSNDIRFLVESLGGTVTINECIKSYKLNGIKKYGKNTFIITIKLDRKDLFKLTRKRDRLKERVKYFPRRYITKIEPSRTTKCLCIRLADKDNLYLTNNFIVTHNSAVAIAMASQFLVRGEYKKLIITRPCVEVAKKSLGALPGGLKDKFDPYLKAAKKELKKFLGEYNYMKFTSEGCIEFLPLEYMRGETFDDTVMVLDEAQNADFEQLKMFITRIGENSKVLINGDIDQSDLKKFSKSDNESDLEFIINRTAKLKGFAHIEFGTGDIVRNPLIERFLLSLKD